SRSADAHGFEAMVSARARSSYSHQIRSQATILLWQAQQDQLAVEQISDVSHGRFERVRHEGDVSAVEIPAVNDELMLCIHDRVVADAIDLDLQNGFAPRQDIQEDADNLRSTPYRVSVLKAQRIVLGQVIELVADER